jgi:hypothetical protein
MADMTAPPRTPAGLDWAAWILIVAVLLLIATVVALFLR